MELFLILGLIFVGCALILFRTKVGVLIRGFWGLFVEDVAKSPEGIKSTYNQAIEEARENYIKVDDALRLVTGKLNGFEKEKADLEKELKRVEKHCEDLAKAGDRAGLEIRADQRISITNQIEILDQAIAKYSGILKDTEMVHTSLQKRLRQLETDRDMNVLAVRTNNEVEEMFNLMDDLKKASNTEVLLGYAREGVKSSNERVAGAKAVHENRMSTKVSRLDDASLKKASDDYVQTLLDNAKKTQ